MKKTNRNLFDKIREFFGNLVKRITEFYKDVEPNSEEGKAVLKMKDQIDQIQQMFAEALVDADENFRGAEAQKNTTREGGMEQYSIRRTSKMSLKEQLREFYKKTFYQRRHWYFGSGII